MPDIIFFEIHKFSKYISLCNEDISNIKFKNIINLNQKKIVNSKFHNLKINKTINFNDKFYKFENDYERHLFLSYEVIKFLKPQL